MKLRWKKIVAVLGAAAIAASSSNAFTVMAGELSEANETVETEEAAEKTKSEESEVSEEVLSAEESTDMEEISSALEDEGSEKSSSAEESTDIEENASDEESSGDVVSDKAAAEENAFEQETSVQETSEETSEESSVEDGIYNEETTDESVEKDETENENVELKPAENLRWSDETPGVALFYNPNDETVSCRCYFYKDGNAFSSFSDGKISGKSDSEIPIFMQILESGTYTYKVDFYTYKEQQDFMSPVVCVSEISNEFVYTSPGALGIPQNIKCNAGRVEWDSVENAYAYDLELSYKEGEKYHVVHRTGILATDGTYVDCSDKLGEGYDYYVRVCTMSDNINKYANGAWSDYIPFNIGEAGGGVNDRLENKLGEVTVDNVADKVRAVKDEFKDSKGELRVAMQTSSKTQNTLKILENTYKDKMGLSTNVVSAEGVDIDTNKVELLGAALNATESGTVIFNMSKPDEEVQNDLIAKSGFKNAIALNIDLEGAGITKGKPLDIPVKVTMPVPKGININSLAVLHYNDDGTYETLEVRKDSDGMISFTVTHFSNFVFGEKEQSPSDKKDEPSTEGNSSSDGDSNSADIIDRSWKPTTSDEIKRYSFYSMEKVNYTADMANIYPVTITNAMQGKLCFDSFEAVLGDYKMGRTYTILPNKNGKIVYKMPTAAKITLAIPKSLQSADREYKMICVTEKGLPIVLDDLDTNSDTITFSTDSYYAFALVYMDAAPMN